MKILESQLRNLIRQELQEIVGFSAVRIKRPLRSYEDAKKAPSIGYKQLIDQDPKNVRPYIEYQEDIENPMKIFIPDDFISAKIILDILSKLKILNSRKLKYYDVVSYEELSKVLDDVNKQLSKVLDDVNKQLLSNVTKGPLNFPKENIEEFRDMLQYLLGDGHYSPSSINFVIAATPLQEDFASPQWFAHDILGHVLASSLVEMPTSLSGKYLNFPDSHIDILNRMSDALTPDEFKFGDKTDLLPDFVVAYLKKKINDNQVIEYMKTNLSKELSNDPTGYAKLIIGFLKDHIKDFIGKDNIGKFVFAKPW